MVLAEFGLLGLAELLQAGALVLELAKAASLVIQLLLQHLLLGLLVVSLILHVAELVAACLE